MDEPTKISLLARQIAHESGSTLDLEELGQVREVISRAGANWPSEGMKILREKNLPLLEKLSEIEGYLDSLILIPNKNQVLKKDFNAKLKEYESTILFCIEYANRHIRK